MANVINTIEINKSILSDRWGEFFDQFSDGNRGRLISLEIIDSEFGDEVLIKNAPFLAIVYDRPGKGDDLVIEVGQKEVTYAHTVDSPREVSTGQNSIGQILAICVTDASGTKTLIQLQAD
jgi:hypothetical protein